MSQVESFLTTSEEQEVIAAIRQAERHTSGEIRVHLEKSSGELKAFDRATLLFHQLKMDNTKEENGVLIYVAVEDHTFSICGDKGIDKVVPKNFWESTKNTIQEHFVKGEFKQGLISGILLAGKELSAHFPWDDNDIDELTNEISKG
ncbi:TPM domain-containing protein [Spongiivirga citrea]|uniref:TPM domain-containing protein n=1 Tax=Spongiivirga citrea TaxID=1481457 RepID=A0A6M0CRM5_9FLAO|nr:TPM domain-containing protein [Spongiivirga citrea]NER18734.1 TPM domain-containing protein [Spongiivirga citrea]